MVQLCHTNIFKSGLTYKIKRLNAKTIIEIYFQECKIKPLKYRGFIFPKVCVANLLSTAVPHYITEQRKKVSRLLKQSS